MTTANIVKEYLAALQNQDLNAIVALYAEGATVEDPVGSPMLIGTAAIKAFYQRATSVKLNAELLGDVRQAGDFVAFPFAITLPNEQGQVRMEIIDTFKLDKAGKITEMKAYWSKENCKPSK